MKQKLIFINQVGRNFKGLNLYEFLFTNVSDVKLVSGDDWDSYPANGNPKPPIDYVTAAYKLETDIKLELIQNHEAFDMADCKAGVIAIGWESNEEYDVETYGERLFFSYGENLESIKTKFYKRDINLESTYESTVQK